MNDPRVADALELLRPLADVSSSSDALDQIVHLLHATAAPLDRNQFVPGHVTTSGLVVNGDSVALVFHTRIGAWLQPGGHVDVVDGSLADAAEREIAEETGLRALECAGVFDLDVHEVIGKVGEPVHQHFDVRFLFRAESQAPLTPADDVSDARWVKVDEVAALTQDQSVLRMIRKLSNDL